MKEQLKVALKAIKQGEESAECIAAIGDKIESPGYELDMSKGDHIDWREKQ